MRHIHFFIRVVYINFKMYLKVQDNTFIRRITMGKTEQVEKLTNYMANFVSYIGKVLPDDIIAKLDELAEKEDSPLSKTIYQTMKLNQKLAKDLNRPSCQDTGVYSSG